MNELRKAIEEAAGYYGTRTGDDRDDGLTPESRGLNEAAKKWAAASLDVFRDELLRKALAVSAAVKSATAALAIGK